MKVFQVIAAIGTEYLAPRHSIPELARGIVANSVNIELHFLDNIPAHLTGASCDVVNYPRHDRINLGWLPEMLKGLKVAYKTADIIHNNTLWMMLNVYADWLSCGSACKSVVAPRGTFVAWNQG